MVFGRLVVFVSPPELILNFYSLFFNPRLMFGVYSLFLCCFCCLQLEEGHGGTRRGGWLGRRGVTRTQARDVTRMSLNTDVVTERVARLRVRPHPPRSSFPYPIVHEDSDERHDERRLEQR